MATFTHLILTAPTERIALVYRTLLEDLQADPCGLAGPATELLCVSDPVGVRIGSGGGTLNALDYANRLIGREAMSRARVLIIHSGGDSRRAPLHSVCGKAWASINANQRVSSPVALLITELSRFCSNLQDGAVVIASSDVLLDICIDGQELSSFPPDAISVIGVPETPAIAKNHGVLVVDATATFPRTPTPYRCTHYLQKPSVAQMHEVGAVSTSNTVFIDTGVVIATGSAFNALLAMLDHPILSLCTARGLLEQQTEGQGALRLELYSDLLHACSLLQQQCSLADYYTRLGIKPTPESSSSQPTLLARALPAVHEALSTTPLYLVAVQGTFFHLGTSMESLEMLCSVDPSSSTSSSSSSSSSARSKVDAFSYKYQLQQSVGSAVIGPPFASRCVLMNSLLLLPPTTDTDSSISRDGGDDNHSPPVTSVIEHSLLSGTFSVSPGCVISNLDAHLGRDLGLVRSGVMLQQVYLGQGEDAAGEAVSAGRSALLVLAVADDVKSPVELDGTSSGSSSTLCGGQWSHFFRLSGLSPECVWPATDDKSLWTARVFCVVPEGPVGVVKRVALTWMQHMSALRDDEPGVDAVSHLADLAGVSLDVTLSALEYYRKAQRVSLSDLLTAVTPGDASSVFSWRRILKVAIQRDVSGYGQLQLDLEGSCVGVIGGVFDCMRESQLTLSKAQEFSSSPLSDAASHLLALWCVRLCGGESAALMETAQRALPKASCQTLLSAFDSLWAGVGKLGTEATCLAVMYLKAASGRGNFLSASTLLLTMSSAALPAPMHPRALLLVSWLFRLDSPTSASASSAEHGSSPSVPGLLSLCLARLDALGMVPSDRLSDYGAAAAEALQSAMFPLPSHVMVPAESPSSVSQQCQDAAQRIVALQVQASLASFSTRQAAPLGERGEGANGCESERCVVVSAPVRIDLAGGWSDTPSLTYEPQGGSVLNCAVRVDGRQPIQCVCRRIEAPVLQLRSMRLCADGEGGPRSLQGDEIECAAWADLSDVSAGGPCALLKAALIVLGVVPLSANANADAKADADAKSLSDVLLSRWGHGLELACLSDLPAGSGMGGSSILAAAVLRAITACLGLPASQDELVYLVLQLEQTLTTGGGWQDQIGGAFGGFKIGRSSPGLPLRVSVEQREVSQEFVRAFERRCFLIFTGKQRLAKNVLINALRRGAICPAAGEGKLRDSTLARLVDGAEAGFAALASPSHSVSAISSGARVSGDDQVDSLAAVLRFYWGLKKEMAAGSEPPRIRALLDQLRPLTSGLSLCGAGGGGFAVVILRSDVAGDGGKAVLLEALRTHSLTTPKREGEGDGEGDGQGEDELMSVHDVSLDMDGLSVQEVPSGGDVKALLLRTLVSV